MRALKDYIKTLPIEKQKQIKITLVVDFDPSQGSELTAEPDIKTLQFLHINDWNFQGLGWLANEDELGLSVKNIYTNTDESSDHAISSFYSDIEKLSEGKYTWDDKNQKFVPQ